MWTIFVAELIFVLACNKNSSFYLFICPEDLGGATLDNPKFVPGKYSLFFNITHIHYFFVQLAELNESFTEKQYFLHEYTKTGFCGLWTYYYYLLFAIFAGLAKNGSRNWGYLTIWIIQWRLYCLSLSYSKLVISRKAFKSYRVGRKVTD